MTLQYEQPSINLQGAQATFALSFDSNATEQTDILFNNWEELLAKISGIPGIKDIIIAGAGQSVIPAGTYDMTDIRLIGESALSQVDATDAVFQSLEYIESLQIFVGNTAANTVSNFQYNSGTPLPTLTMVRSRFHVGPLAAFPIVDITNGTVVSLRAFDSSFSSSNVGVPTIHIDAAPSNLIAIPSAGSAGNNWGGPNGSPAFVVVDVGGMFTLGLGTGDIFWAANQTLGPTTTNRLDDYESAVVADWSGTEPESVKAALDRIAAAIGPIA